MGLNIYRGDVELNNTLPLPLQPAGAFRFEGDGTGLGGNAGVLWTVDRQNAVGLVYRSPFQIDFDGPAVIDRGRCRPLVPAMPTPESTSRRPLSLATPSAQSRRSSLRWMWNG